MKVAIIAAIVMACCSFAHASESSHRAAVEKMLQAIHAERDLEDMYGQVGAMMDQQFETAGLPADAMPIVLKYKDKQMAMLKKVLSWDRIKEDIIQSYMSVYSEEEVKEITKFYTSPIGVKYVSKMPELSDEVMNSMHKMLPGLLANSQQIGQEMAAELQLYQKSKEKSP